MEGRGGEGSGGEGRGGEIREGKEDSIIRRGIVQGRGGEWRGVLVIVHTHYIQSSIVHTHYIQ